MFTEAELEKTNDTNIRVLHVDDDETSLALTKMFLEEIDKQITVDSVTKPEKAINLQNTHKYDLVLSDYKMDKMTGIELLQKLRASSNVPFILYTGKCFDEIQEDVLKLGMDGYLMKGAEPDHYEILIYLIKNTVKQTRKFYDQNFNHTN